MKIGSKIKIHNNPNRMYSGETLEVYKILKEGDEKYCYCHNIWLRDPNTKEFKMRTNKEELLKRGIII
jgi:hypothetical protein